MSNTGYLISRVAEVEILQQHKGVPLLALLFVFVSRLISLWHYAHLRAVWMGRRMSFKKTQCPLPAVRKGFYASAFALGVKKRGGEAQF